MKLFKTKTKKNPLKRIYQIIKPKIGNSLVLFLREEFITVGVRTRTTLATLYLLIRHIFIKFITKLFHLALHMISMGMLYHLLPLRLVTQRFEKGI